MTKANSTSERMKLTKAEWGLVSGLLLLSLIPCAGGALRLIELGTGEVFEFLPENPRMRASPFPFQVHLATALPYCILGIIQFLPSVRRKHLALHRKMGRVLAVAAILSAASALWMTQYYDYPGGLQSDFLYVVRIIVGLSMLAFVALGVSAVLGKKQGKIRKHQAWMIRAYALGQGAGTQAFLGVPWTIVSGGEPNGIARDIIMAAGWGVNAVVAEWVIRKKT